MHQGSAGTAAMVLKEYLDGSVNRHGCSPLSASGSENRVPE